MFFCARFLLVKIQICTQYLFCEGIYYVQMYRLNKYFVVSCFKIFTMLFDCFLFVPEILLCYTSHLQLSSVQQDGDLKYSLYGVLVHSGSSTHSGHYFCYVRTSNNMWYTLDDNRVLKNNFF